MKKNKLPKNAESVRAAVRTGYAAIAAGNATCCTTSTCCGGDAPGRLAAELGYTAKEIAQLPAGANMGLSCGNPTALAALKPGETVLDIV